MSSYGRAGREFRGGGRDEEYQEPGERARGLDRHASLAAIITGCRRRQGRSASEQQHRRQRQPPAPASTAFPIQKTYAGAPAPRECLYHSLHMYILT